MPAFPCGGIPPLPLLMASISCWSESVDRKSGDVRSAELIMLPEEPWQALQAETNTAWPGSPPPDGEADDDVSLALPPLPPDSVRT